MTNYTLWADRGTGAEKIYEVAKHLKKCAGGKVNVLGIGPSVGQNYGRYNGKGTVAVYMVNGVGIATPNDLNNGCKPGGYYQYERAIFVWSEKIANNQYMSDHGILTHIVPGEHDWNRDQAYNIGGQTAAQWFPKHKYVDLVAGNTPEDIAQRICNNVYVTEKGNPKSNSSSDISSSSGSSSNSSGSSSSSSDSGSEESPLLQGDMTFEELVGDICNGIDLMFLVKRGVVIVDDFSSIYAQAKYLRDTNKKVVGGEDIQLWELEEDSYDEFVRVYGKISITYNEPKLDKTSAIMKAKSYLAAHVRDFEMTVNLSMLNNGDIDIGDIVTVENPQTSINKTRKSQGRDPEYLFVNGLTTDWEGDGYITSDLELKFAPTSPKNAEVPTSGTATGKSTSGSSKSSGSSSNKNTLKNTGMTYNKCGVSKDKKTICAIGKASAIGDVGGGFYRSIFKNYCPMCGQTGHLVWGIFWAGENTNWGYLPCKGTSEGGSGEGHVFCKACDADYSCPNGKEHSSPPKATLKRADSGPVKVSKKEAYKLLKGNYQP